MLAHASILPDAAECCNAKTCLKQISLLSTFLLVDKKEQVHCCRKRGLAAKKSQRVPGVKLAPDRSAALPVAWSLQKYSREIHLRSWHLPRPDHTRSLLIHDYLITTCHQSKLKPGSQVKVVIIDVKAANGAKTPSVSVTSHRYPIPSNTQSFHILWPADFRLWFPKTRKTYHPS